MFWQEVITSTASVLAILSVMVLTLRYLNAQTDARFTDLKDSFAELNAASDARIADLNAQSDARFVDFKDSIATQNDKIHDDIQSLRTDVKALTTEMSTHRENDIKLTVIIYLSDHQPIIRPHPRPSVFLPSRLWV